MLSVDQRRRHIIATAIATATHSSPNKNTDVMLPSISAASHLAETLLNG